MLASSKHTDAVTVEDAGQRELPDGWAATTLGEACLINPRFFTEPVEDDRELTFLPMAAVEAGTGRIDLSQTRLFAEVRKGYTKFSEGDVLFAKITPSMENGKVAVAKGLTNNCGCGSTEFHVLRPRKGISGDFLLFFFLHDAFRSEARAHMAGTAGQLRVPAGFLEEADFELPPLPEQHRIVAEIEKQFTRLDASVAALKRVQANLKRYRASVLKAACEGKLVPTEAQLARAEGRDYEPADRLLERILTEHRARWESQENRRGKYKEPIAPDTSDLPELPEGWLWSRFDQVVSTLEGGTAVSATNTRSNRPVLRSSAVRQGLVDYEDFRYLPDGAKQGTDPYIATGDLLFTRLSGTLEYVGNCAVVGELRGRKIEFPDRIFRGRCVSGISPNFIQLAFAEKTLRRSLEAKAKSSAGHQRISLADLREYCIPLPPHTEQRRIVAEVERRLSVIQQAESIVEANLAKAERLRQSILKQAFSGNLVSQDPNDEPASKLLERIRAEREATQLAASNRPKPRRSKISSQNRSVLKRSS